MCWIVLVPCPALSCLTWSILVRSGLPMAYLVLSCAALHCPALWSVVLCCLTCSCLVMSCVVSCARVWSHLFGSSEVWSGLVLSVRHGLVWSGLSCLVFSSCIAFVYSKRVVSCLIGLCPVRSGVFFPVLSCLLSSSSLHLFVSLKKAAQEYFARSESTV